MTTVLHVTPAWLPRTETWLYNQVRHLPETVSSHIFCEQSFNEDQFALPNIWSLRDQARVAFYVQKALRKATLARGLASVGDLAKKIQPSVIHSHFGQTGWANAGRARDLGIPSVVSFYGVDVGKVPLQSERWRRRYQQMFEETDAFLCEGPFMKQSLVNLGCDAAKVAVHRLGIEVDTIGWQPRTWTQKRPLRLLMASSFRQKKGIPLAVDALAGLRGTFPFHLTLVGDSDGTPPSEAEKARIVDGIKAGGLEDSVTMAGFVRHDELKRLAYNHDVFLAPSITADDGDCEGGCPVSLIEMAATGLPVIASTHCDIPQLIKHGETGLLAKEGDVDDLRGQITHLVEHPETWEAMSRAARQHIETNYDCHRQGQALAGIYEQLSRQSGEVFDAAYL